MFDDVNVEYINIYINSEIIQLLIDKIDLIKLQGI